MCHVSKGGDGARVEVYSYRRGMVEVLLGGGALISRGGWLSVDKVNGSLSASAGLPGEQRAT